MTTFKTSKFSWTGLIGSIDHTDLVGLNPLPTEFSVQGRLLKKFTFTKAIHINEMSEDIELIGNLFTSECGQFTLRIYND